MNKGIRGLLGDDIFNLGSISNAIFEWFEPGYHYELVKMEGKQYIHINKNKPNDYKKTELYYVRISQNKNIIFDLLDCIPNVTLIEWENIASCINLKKLYFWCHKYGLPDSSINKEVYFGDLPACHEDGYVLYEPLCKEIAIIRLVYELWLAYYTQNIKEYKRCVIKILDSRAYCMLNFIYFSKKEVSEREIDDFANTFMNIEISDLNIIGLNINIFRAIFSHHLAYACYLHFDSIYNSDSLTVEDIKKLHNSKYPLISASTMTHTAIDLCFFQLFSLVNYGGTTRHIKECQNCHDTFWAKNGHAKYCSNCDRRLVWYHKHKDK